MEDRTFLKVILKLEKGAGIGPSWLRSWRALGRDKDFVRANEKLVIFLSWRMCCDFTLIERILQDHFRIFQKSKIEGVGLLLRILLSGCSVLA